MPTWELTTPLVSLFFIPHLKSKRIMGMRRWHFINPRELVWLLPLDSEPQGNKRIHVSEQGVTVEISMKEVWWLSLQERVLCVFCCSEDPVPTSICSVLTSYSCCELAARYHKAVSQACPEQHGGFSLCPQSTWTWLFFSLLFQEGRNPLIFKSMAQAHCLRCLGTIRQIKVAIVKEQHPRPLDLTRKLIHLPDLRSCWLKFVEFSDLG